MVVAFRFTGVGISVMRITGEATLVNNDPRCVGSSGMPSRGLEGAAFCFTLADVPPAFGTPTDFSFNVEGVNPAELVAMTCWDVPEDLPSPADLPREVFGSQSRQPNATSRELPSVLSTSGTSTLDGLMLAGFLLAMVLICLQGLTASCRYTSLGRYVEATARDRWFQIRAFFSQHSVHIGTLVHPQAAHGEQLPPAESGMDADGREVEPESDSATDSLDGEPVSPPESCSELPPDSTPRGRLQLLNERARILPASTFKLDLEMD